jgi:hypothetical protein
MPTNVGGILEDDAYRDARYELLYAAWARSKGRWGILWGSIMEQFRLFRKIERGSSVWFYNVNRLNLTSILLLRVFKPSVQVNPIVLDFTPRSSVYSRFCLWVINHSHGYIRLADSPLFTCRNSLLLPGVVPATSGSEPRIEEVNNRFLLSGVLAEQIAQTSMVLRAFAELPECELHITGFIQDDSEIKDFATRYPNIIYHGTLNFAGYLQVMHSCSYQLSTRDPHALENQCNFPSKIIETLLHNRIVVSTLDYKQLGEVKYLRVDSTLEQFIKDIRAIQNLSPAEKLGYANQGEKVARLFNVEVWKDAMQKIESV